MKYQFMPMFWGDFFADTLHLSAQELGAYTALIGHAWKHDGNIAVSDLQRVARVNNAHWYKIRPRLEPFFTTSMEVGFWFHERVHSELTKAAEISNKRKDAALQMHSKSRANGYANDPHLHLQLPIEKLSNGKGSEAAPMQVQGNFRDPGVEYRAPPRSKSDNPLMPIPDRPLAAAKRK